MSDSVLMIMNARELPECINPLRKLEIDKVWFRAFPQVQVEKEIRRFVKSNAYDRYLLVSDDAIVSRESLESVLRWQDNYDILTGWCNLSPSRFRANVILHPLKKVSYFRLGSRMPRFLGRHLAGLVSGGVFPFKHLYERVAFNSFPSYSDINRLPEVFETFFMGGPLLSMSGEHWLKYNFKSPSWGGPALGADMALSEQIANDGLRMWCVRDAFCYHLHTTRNFLVGRVDPEVIHIHTRPAQELRSDS